MISRYAPQDFIEVMKNSKGLPMEIPHFNLEYYVGDSFIFLYKTIHNKTFKTVVLVSPTESETLSVFWDGREMTVEQFIEDLRMNEKAHELIEPLDKTEIITKHNHDIHTHGGVCYNDIFNGL